MISMVVSASRPAPEDVADKTSTVHAHGAAVVGGVPVGRLGVASHIFGTEVEVIVFMGLQLPDYGFTGDTYGSHVVGAALHLGFHRVEGVLSVKHRYIPGAVRDGEGSVCFSRFFRFL